MSYLLLFLSPGSEFDLFSESSSEPECKNFMHGLHTSLPVCEDSTRLCDKLDYKSKKPDIDEHLSLHFLHLYPSAKQSSTSSLFAICLSLLTIF